MQVLAKVSSELRHNAAGPAPSILIIKKSRAEAPEIQVRQIKHSFTMNSAERAGLLFAARFPRRKRAEESQVDADALMLLTGGDAVSTLDGDAAAERRRPC